MTIGKNSRKSSARSSIRAPKFLDKSSGFYGRLDEPEAAGEGEKVRGKEVEETFNWTEDSIREGGVASSPSPSEVRISGADEKEEVEAFDLNEGMMEDDGGDSPPEETQPLQQPLEKKLQEEAEGGRAEEDTARDERPSLGTESPVDPHVLKDTKVMIEVNKMEEKDGKAGKGKEPTLVHFPVREDADDQVLIRDRKREEEEERKMKREQEEGKKVVKRNTGKNYRKALDRAFRRGWEAFITNIYSVTLTPVTSSSPPSSSPSPKKKQQSNLVLAEFL